MRQVGKEFLCQYNGSGSDMLLRRFAASRPDFLILRARNSAHVSFGFEFLEYAVLLSSFSGEC